MNPDKVKRPEDLDKLDKDGLIAFLGSGRSDKMELWNKWRAEHALEVEGIDLQGANLVSSQLDGIDLSYVHLEGADLGSAHLDNARLDGAQLQRAHLRGTFMRNASLCWANLEHADLTAGYFQNSNLAGAFLHHTDLHEAYLEDAKFINAHLIATNLHLARLQGSDLRLAHIEETNLHYANLRGANLSRATLHTTSVAEAYLGEVDLRQAHLTDTALSEASSLRGVKLYQTYFWKNIVNLRYELFLDEHERSTIWEETRGRFEEAKDVYKTLKGYFEDAGDYEGANWAYEREQEMEKLMYAPLGVRWLYSRWRGKWSPEDYEPSRKPSVREWLRLEFSDKLAGYGLSLGRPLVWLAALVLLCTAVYWLGGMVTAQPGCGYDQLSAAWRSGCAPTRSLVDNLMFSLGALTSTETGNLQPYLSGVRLLMTLEVLFGIALTGLFGFVLGNRLRYS